MLRTITITLLGALTLFGVCAIFIGARDGVHRRRIRAPHTLRDDFTGERAVVYGWFSVIGGGLIVALAMWGLVTALRVEL